MTRKRGVSKTKNKIYTSIENVVTKLLDQMKTDKSERKMEADGTVERTIMDACLMRR